MGNEASPGLGLPGNPGPITGAELPGWVTPPAYGEGSLAQVIPRALNVLGVNLESETPPDEAEAVGVLLVLADGLGWSNLEQRRGHAPFCWNAPRERLRTGFPSTTVASLGTFGTGLPPGCTGLAGYSLRDPATRQRATLIKWDTPTVPEQWQPHRTWFERLNAAGYPATFIGESRFQNSALTLSSLRGAQFRSASKKAASKVEIALKAMRETNGLLYLYWGNLDKVGHAKGWESVAWSAALEELDHSLQQLAAQLPPGWELWVTSDHGMIDVTGAPQWDVTQEPTLAAQVDLVAGEARAVHLYTNEPQAVAERWAEFLGAAAWVLTREQAVAQGLFGQVEQRVLPYLGDVVVAMAGRATVVDTASQGQAPAQMVGQHGSLTAPEMEIPLIRVKAN